MPQLVPALVAEMGPAYPELVNQQPHYLKRFGRRGTQFARTLDNGMRFLKRRVVSARRTVLIPGDVIFRLYDTYGFPVDLTNDIARERGLELDLDGYEAAMPRQRKRSQESGALQVDYNNVCNCRRRDRLFGLRQTTVHANGPRFDSREVNRQQTASEVMRGLSFWTARLFTARAVVRWAIAAT